MSVQFMAIKTFPEYKAAKGRMSWMEKGQRAKSKWKWKEKKTEKNIKMFDPLFPVMVYFLNE